LSFLSPYRSVLASVPASMWTIRMILLGYLLLSASAFPDVYLRPDEPGGAGWWNVAYASAATDGEPAVSPSTTKELVAFPAGENYYYSVFAYKITHTMRTRLERTPSVQLIAACLAQYRRIPGPAQPAVQEAAITTRTWRSHQGTIYQAVELLLAAQARNTAGRSVPYILSCPLNEDDSLDAKGMDVYLTAFKQGMPIK
jgi:hypothetical protein